MNHPSFSPPASLRPLSSTYGVGSLTYGLNPLKTVIDGLEPQQTEYRQIQPSHRSGGAVCLCQSQPILIFCSIAGGAKRGSYQTRTHGMLFQLLRLGGSSGYFLLSGGLHFAECHCTHG